MHIKIKRQTYLILERRHYYKIQTLRQKEKLESGCQRKGWAARRISPLEVFHWGMARVCWLGGRKSLKPQCDSGCTGAARGKGYVC